MEDRVKELESKLKQVVRERDDLQRDVEALCLQGDGFLSFSSSSVLSDRITHAEKQLSMVQAKLEAVSAERDSLREDLRGFRDSKRQADQSWRRERERVEALESELSFYQTEFAGATSERDKATWEAEELRASNLALEERLGAAEAQTEKLQDSETVLTGQLQAAQKDISRLEGFVEECQAIPGLRKDLTDARHRGNQLQADKEDLQEKLKGKEQALEETREELLTSRAAVAGLQDDLHKARADADAHAQTLQGHAATLRVELEDLRARNAALEERAEEAEGALAAAQAEVEVVTRERQRSVASLTSQAERRQQDMLSSHSQEVTTLQAELAEVRRLYKQCQADLEQASSQKVSALSRLSAAEATAEQAFTEVGDMRDQLADLRERLNQASQEKVAALMQAAAAQGGQPGHKWGQGNSSEAGKAVSTAGSRMGQWKLWGNTSPQKVEAASPDATQMPNGEDIKPAQSS